MAIMESMGVYMLVLIIIGVRKFIPHPPYPPKDPIIIRGRNELAIPVMSISGIIHLDHPLCWGCGTNCP